MTRNEIPSNETIHLVSFYSHTPTSFSIIRTLGRGASCIAYEAYQTIDDSIVQTGVLKEFYPTFYPTLFRDPLTNHLFYSGKSDSFEKEKELLLSRYDLIKDATRDGRNPKFSSFIPPCEIFITPAGVGKTGTCYIFTPKVEMEVFADFLSDCEQEQYADDNRKLLSLFRIVFDLFNLTECIQILHESNIIALDIKPSNFGIRKRKDSHLGVLEFFDINSFFSENTLSLKTTGTDGFRDPALFQYGPTPKSDIYSIGCTLLYAFIGKKAFYKEVDVRNSLTRLINESYILSQVSFERKEEFVSLLKEIVKRCLGSIRNRYDDCAALARELQKLVAMIAPLVLNSYLPQEFRWYLVDNGFYINCTAEALWTAEKKHYGEMISTGRFSGINLDTTILSNAIIKSNNNPDETKDVAFSEAADRNEMKPLDVIIKHLKKSVFVQGDGGIGKTTACIAFLREYYSKETYDGDLIPVFIDLSFAPSTIQKCYLGEAAEQWAKADSYPPEMKSSFIRRKIYSQLHSSQNENEESETDALSFSLKGSWNDVVKPINNILKQKEISAKILLLLDGINEIPTTELIENSSISPRDLITQEIKDILSFGASRAVLTARTYDCSFEDCGFDSYYVLGLTEEQRDTFLENHSFSHEAIETIKKDHRLSTVLLNPLFLTIYASLRNRENIVTCGEILRRFLLEKGQNAPFYSIHNRLVEIDTNAKKIEGLNQKNQLTQLDQSFILDFILPEIAFEMEVQGKKYFFFEDLADIIKPALYDTSDTSVCGNYGQRVFAKYRGTKAKDSVKSVATHLSNLTGSFEDTVCLIMDCCNMCLGLVKNTDGKYSFIHQHFKDYFAAVKIINSLCIAAELFEDHKWQEAQSCLYSVLRDSTINPQIKKFVNEHLGEYKNQAAYYNGLLSELFFEQKADRTLLHRAILVLHHTCQQESGFTLYNILSMMHIQDVSHFDEPVYYYFETFSESKDLKDLVGDYCKNRIKVSKEEKLSYLEAKFIFASIKAIHLSDDLFDAEDYLSYLTNLQQQAWVYGEPTISLSMLSDYIEPFFEKKDCITKEQIRKYYIKSRIDNGEMLIESAKKDEALYVLESIESEYPNLFEIDSECFFIAEVNICYIISGKRLPEAMSRMKELYDRCLTLLNEEKKLELIYHLGYFYYLSNQIDDTIKALNQAEQYCRTHPGKHPGYLAKTLNQLAFCYSNKSAVASSEEAKKQFANKAYRCADESLKTRIDLFGERNKYTATGHDTMARIMKDCAAIMNSPLSPEAFEHAKTALKINEYLFENTSINVARNYQTLAILYEFAGDNEKALTFINNALRNYSTSQFEQSATETTKRIKDRIKKKMNQ